MTVTTAPVTDVPAVAAPVKSIEDAAAQYAKFLSHGEKPIDKYIYLRDLMAQSPEAFFALLGSHTEEILPFVYTPTVGEACQRYHELPLTTRGLYITWEDKGKIAEKLAAWPNQDIQVAVVTDGERILGLGDQGAGGMGISEGKILLYTAAAGVDPKKCLPICLDVGTNNQERRNDPQYKGLKRDRPVGAEYDEFVNEFIDALVAWRPHMLLQWEDFGNSNAFRFLEDNKQKICSFNDDIQGTAAITLAGLLSALRASGKPLSEQRVLFLGAGEAGCGIGELIALAIAKEKGESVEEARKHCMFMDSRGLVCSTRDNLQHHKLPFAHELPHCADLLSAVQTLKPTALIGVSTIAGAFTKEVITTMAEINEVPIIMPLSNPTVKAECTYEQAFNWTNGKLAFASGSPFGVIEANGVTYHPAQANNAYIFPAVGHACALTHAKHIPDSLFLVAANTLANLTTLDELSRGWLFPSFDNILKVSHKIMVACMEHIVAEGLGSVPEGADISAVAAEACGLKA